MLASAARWYGFRPSDVLSDYLALAGQARRNCAASGGVFLLINGDYESLIDRRPALFPRYGMD